MTTRPHPSGADHWTRRTPDRIRRGVDAPGAKLSAADIQRLSQYADGGWRPSELASHFDVSRQTIWRHIRRAQRNTR